ncbi:type I-E CRISPR-associated protein Cse2/CasB [Streptomyces antimicrobicus]|uniref:Type I-E CRISPR-associated protein Cse2/CasB n=1 Tax=Streptomyces antimicrobicus TaxID=2883108 RepID=A0ABS8B7T3_9ACTN|nr:type I-E CRISPR-associated protein Cse2/CasB [Streptomyces antimicrobicus]MCB5180673.1 type I-E CRISPR-associated protein Cse2/CasB [Streptomyces antimicrobicus]
MTRTAGEQVPAGSGYTLGTTVPEQRKGERLSRERDFVARMEELCSQDPGARAALRSGLRKGLDEVPRMHRFVAPRLPQDRTPREVQRAYYAVASMIAAQPRVQATGAQGGQESAESAGGPGAAVPPAAAAAGEGGKPGQGWGSSLGAAFAAAVGSGREAQMREVTAESRLNLLTRQSAPGLHRHLPAAVGYLRSLDVPVDFAQLLSDLANWPRHSGRIARRWLQDYYRIRARDAHEAANRRDLSAAGEDATA